MQDNADRNLLLGMLALQMDFIQRDRLIDALQQWMLNKKRSLDEILMERGWMTAEQQAALTPLIDLHVNAHGNEPHKSLAALATAVDIVPALRELEDADVNQSIASFSDESAQDSGSNSQVLTRLDPGTDSDLSTLETIVPAVEHTGDGQRYRVLRPHAEGGLGKVSVAEDQELHREVAFKEIKAKYARRNDVQQRFVLEAEITGGLEHPGVVPVYGLGKYPDGRPFYAMRFIRGDSLADAIKQFHAPRRGDADAQDSVTPKNTRPKRPYFSDVQFRELISRFIDVCFTIEYAHSRNVLHRDLKPENILVGRYGETLVVDWGLAKATGKPELESTVDMPGTSTEGPLEPSSGSDVKETQAGRMLGTPLYMSPEQAEGRLDELGPATDIYSLGATLYQILTGQASIVASQTGTSQSLPVIEIAERVRTGKFSPPRTVLADVPRGLEAICLKAMALKPSDRYASAASLIADLKAWLADEPVSAWREPRRVRVGRWIRRHQKTTSAITTAVLLLATGLTAYGFDRAVRLDASRQLEKNRLFRELSDSALREGVHALREIDPNFESADDSASVEEPDEAVTNAEAALNVYGVLEDDWNGRLDVSTLPDEEATENRRRVAVLLTLIGVRKGMAFVDNETGRKATREALRLFDLAEKFQPAGTGTWLARMLFHRRLDEDEHADRAGEEMSRTFLVEEMSATDLYLFGVVTLRLLEKPKDARQFFHQAIAKEPNNYGANWSLFVACRELKDVEGQINAITACLTLRPEATLYYIRGFLQFARRNYVQAEYDFASCLERDPTLAIGHYWKGRMQVLRDDWASAEDAFARAAELDPELDVLYSWRAVATAKLGRLKEAHDFVRLASELPNTDGSIPWRCARALSISAQVTTQRKARTLSVPVAQLRHEAVDTLRSLADSGYFAPDRSLASLLSSDLDGLRGTPEFETLVDELASPILQDESLADSRFLKQLRITLLARRGDHKAAAATAAALRSRARETIGVSESLAQVDLYNAACAYAKCIPAVAVRLVDGVVTTRAADELSEVEQEQQAEYRSLAIEVLQEAIDVGYDDLDHTLQDPDLNPLRDDPAFEQLLHTMRSQADKANSTAEVR